MKKDYPQSLFWLGFITNVVFQKFFLFVPAIVLLIIGIWVKICLLIGIAILALDIVISFVSQVKIRNTVINSDDPNFTPFQEAMLSSDWPKSVMDLVEQKIGENAEE